MIYKTHNDKNIAVGGTHLQGGINTTFEKLVDAFGEPTSGDGYKVDAEWEIEFENPNSDTSVIATIYNWKNGKNYLGCEEGMDVEDITDWHIGGFNQDAVLFVKQVLNN